jgi:hypothetical protein
METKKGRDGNIASDHWATPPDLYNKLDKEFHFDFDPCPLHSTFDGTKVEWGESNFINPPYSKSEEACGENCKKKSCKSRGYHIDQRIAGKEDFIQKAYDEWKLGKICVLLIPVSTSTKQFHELIYPHAEIRFLRGRVKFLGVNTRGEYVTNSVGKHDSMIVIFKHETLRY